jgi:hypothetical protein
MTYRFTESSPKLHPPSIARICLSQASCRLEILRARIFGKEIFMNTIFKKLAVVLGVALMGSLLTATANAACGSTQPAKPGGSFEPQSWQGQNDFGSAKLLLTGDHDSGDPIVGMWHVTFTAKGNGSDGPSDGAPIDNAIVQWHADGTEIMNSGRPAQDGNFCMGVWEHTGRFRYKLNHFALGNDTTNAPSGVGDPAGPTRIVEDVVLSPDGNHYTGRFTLDAYDTSGNPTAHIVGVISGTRITVETTVPDLL